MIDEPADVALLRRVRGRDVLYRDSRPLGFVLDVGLQLPEGPEGDPAPPRARFSVPSLVGVPDSLEPLEDDDLVVRPCLLDDKSRGFAPPGVISR